WEAGSLFAVLGLPMSYLDEHAQESAGLDETNVLSFRGNVAIDVLAERYWWSSCASWIGSSTCLDPPLESALVRSEMLRTLART
ncbi:hypothetical protein, partial [Escherichia coli]